MQTVWSREHWWLPTSFSSKVLSANMCPWDSWANVHDSGAANFMGAGYNAIGEYYCPRRHIAAFFELSKLFCKKTCWCWRESSELENYNNNSVLGFCSDVPCSDANCVVCSDVPCSDVCMQWCTVLCAVMYHAEMHPVLCAVMCHAVLHTAQPLQSAVKSLNYRIVACMVLWRKRTWITI